MKKDKQIVAVQIEKGLNIIKNIVEKQEKKSNKKRNQT